MKRDTFIFYRSFFEAINDLTDKQRLELYDAIANYSLNFEQNELKGVSKTVFTLIKPQLDANNKRFVNGCKGAEHGSKGGRPPKPQENPTETPNNNNNINNNKNTTTWEEFKSYALGIKPTLIEYNLRVKYNQWLTDGWRSNNEPINNWKRLLEATIPHLPSNELKPMEKIVAFTALQDEKILQEYLDKGYTLEQIKTYSK